MPWPRKFVLLATGTKFDEHADGDFRIGHWKTDKPSALAGFNLGEYASAKTVGKQAKDTLAAAGDLRGEARSLTCLGNVAEDEGNLSEARAMHEQALILARKIGAGNDVAVALNNFGTFLASKQALGESTRRYQQ